MKKMISLLLALVLCLPLGGCFVSPASDSEIMDFLSGLSSNYSYSYTFPKTDAEETLKKCVKSDNFPLLLQQHLESLVVNQEYTEALQLLKNLKNIDYPMADIESVFDQLIMDEFENLPNDDWSKGFRLLSALDSREYYSENLKTDILSWLQGVRESVFSQDLGTFVTYIDQVDWHFDENYYCSIIDFFPYQELTEMIESRGTKAIKADGAGGYYDDFKNEIKDESYWYSPLSGQKVSRGEVGTYHYSETHVFFGDFMQTYVSKYWYDTDSSDSNNSSYSNGHYKGEFLGSSGKINWDYLFWDAEVEDIYALQEDDEIVLFVIKEAEIIIVYSQQMVTIAYE